MAQSGRSVSICERKAWVKEHVVPVSQGLSTCLALHSQSPEAKPDEAAGSRAP